MLILLQVQPYCSLLKKKQLVLWYILVKDFVFLLHGLYDASLRYG